MQMGVPAEAHSQPNAMGHFLLGAQHSKTVCNQKQNFISFHPPDIFLNDNATT